MTNLRHLLSWLAPYTVTLAAMLMAATALPAAQAPAAAPAPSATPAPPPAATVAPTEDMRLWSFGDCDRRFPYVNTDAHKECVRVVGSPEARDARALRVCEVSHAADKEETARCKAAYLANKEKAAQETQAATSPDSAQQAPSPEVMRRVKAISTAAIEEQRAAAAAAAPPAVEEPLGPAIDFKAEASSGSTLSVVMLVVVLVGLGVGFVRRKQGQSA